MTAFPGCKFCGGSGCLACEGERQKAQEKALEPLFVADLNNPHDMKLLKNFFGREAVERAFSEKTGDLLTDFYRDGVQTIERNAALAHLLQILHAESTPSSEKEE